MGFVDVTGVRHTRSEGRVLFDGVSVRVGDGEVVVGCSASRTTSLVTCGP